MREWLGLTPAAIKRRVERYSLQEARDFLLACKIIMSIIGLTYFVFIAILFADPPNKFHSYFIVYMAVLFVMVGAFIALISTIVVALRSHIRQLERVSHF